MKKNLCLRFEKPWVVLLVFAGLALVVFGKGLTHSLLYWDDFKHLCQNPLLVPREQASLAKIWTQPFFDLYIPLSYTTWWALVQILPVAQCQDLAPFLHGFNILLHLTNAFLVFLCLRKLLSRSPLDAFFPALIGGLVFLLHPMQVEAVAWISGLRDLLSTTGVLLALWIYLGRPENFSWARYTGATFFFAASLLCKPSTAVAPLIFTAIDVLIFSTPWPRLLKRWLPWLALGAASALLTSHLQAADFSWNSDLWQRLQVCFFSLGFYVLKTLWPYPLSVDYALPVQHLQNSPDLWWQALLAALLVVVTLGFLRQKRFLLTGFLIFLLPLLPTSGLMRFSFERLSQVADRFVYLPLVGAALAVASIYGSFPKGRKLWWLILGVWACLSFRQNLVWQDDQHLFQAALDGGYRGSTALGNEGSALYRQQNYATAESLLKESLEKDSENLEAAVTLGHVLEKENKIQDALNFYRSELQQHPGWAVLHNNFASLLANTGGSREEVLEHYRLAVQISPDYFEALLNLGTTLLENRQKEEAKKYLEAARKINPHHPILLQALSDLQK